METMTEWLEQAVLDADLSAEEIPKIDLYMDQILTLLEEGLARNKRQEDEKLVTKTMVNNYTKEHLIMPVKGKKYNREQVMQLLCILSLKQTLSLADLKKLMGAKEGEISFEGAYREALRRKQAAREKFPALLAQLLEGVDLESPQGKLCACLTLSAGATFLRRACEMLIDRKEDGKPDA